MTDFADYIAQLPPHMRPQTDTERLLMQYAYCDGFSDGMREGLAHHNATLLRMVPKEVA